MRFLAPAKLLVFTLLAHFASVALGDDLPLISADAYRGVIIPLEMVQSHRHLTNRFDGFWLPTTNDIAEAETEIAKYLATAQSDGSLSPYTRKQAPAIHKKLKDYRRQYVGVIVGKERRIFCNVLTTDPRMYPDWKRRYIFLIEGAPDCWKIQYVPETHRCLKFDASFGY